MSVPASSAVAQTLRLSLLVFLGIFHLHVFLLRHRLHGFVGAAPGLAVEAVPRTEIVIFRLWRPAEQLCTQVASSKLCWDLAPSLRAASELPVSRDPGAYSADEHARRRDSESSRSTPAASPESPLSSRKGGSRSVPARLKPLTVSTAAASVRAVLSSSPQS